jgi:hypothetical protein
MRVKLIAIALLLLIALAWFYLQPRSPKELEVEEVPKNITPENITREEEIVQIGRRRIEIVE